MTVVRKHLLTAGFGSAPATRVQVHQIDLEPGQATGLHLHLGPVVGYIVAGTIRFQIEGEAPQILGAGSAFFEPANTRIAHFDNASSTDAARFVACYVLGEHDHDLISMLDASSSN